VAIGWVEGYYDLVAGVRRCLGSLLVGVDKLNHLGVIIGPSEERDPRREIVAGEPGRNRNRRHEHQNSCGIFAHRAIEPTKRLFAAVRRAGIPIFYCTQDHRPQNHPQGAISTRWKEKAANAAYHGIYHEFAPQPSDIAIYERRPASSRERHSCPPEPPRHP
jgi:hypothetical protein